MSSSTVCASAGSRRASETPPVAQSYLDDLLTIEPEGYARCCEAIGAFDFRDRLDEIEAPTLVIVGEEDPVTPADVVETLSEGIPRAETVVVPHAAHLANVEQPDAVTAALRRSGPETTLASSPSGRAGLPGRPSELTGRHALRQEVDR